MLDGMLPGKFPRHRGSIQLAVNLAFAFRQIAPTLAKVLGASLPDAELGPMKLQ